MAELGHRLVALHLMEADGEDSPDFPNAGDNKVSKVRYLTPSLELWINNNQYFRGVTPDTWDFSIGGYKPAQKWLKDRQDRSLSFDEIAHYRRICGAIAETVRVMESIEGLIETYGGWPLTGTA